MEVTSSARRCQISRNDLPLAHFLEINFRAYPAARTVFAMAHRALRIAACTPLPAPGLRGQNRQT
eukprot:6181206-Pleurochrysis_carterae.AAC.10